MVKRQSNSKAKPIHKTNVGAREEVLEATNNQ